MNGKMLVVILLILFLIAALATFIVKPAKNNIKYISIENVNAKLKNVNASSVSLEFLIKMHASGSTKNSTLVVSVYDAKTKLLLKELRKNFTGSGYFTVSLNSSFSRFKDYIVKFSVLNHPEALWGLKLYNLSQITPQNQELMISLKSVDFRVVNSSDDFAEILAEFYIQPYRSYKNVSFHVKATQYESNVLADEAWIKNVSLNPEKTKILVTKLKIPKDYNYVICLEGWRNGTLVRSWKRTLNLAPEKPIPKNVSEEKVNFSINKFIKPLPLPITRPSYTPYTKKIAGFELIGCLIAFSLLIFRKRLA